MPSTWHKLRVLNLGLRLFPKLFGYEPRRCNVCHYNGKFLAEIHFPDIFNFDAVCPKCGSLPRNRLLALAVSRLDLLAPDRRMLHFAPEPQLKEFFRVQVSDYLTTDINPKGVDVVADIEQLHFASNCFDIVMCSHVLEHVDHRLALDELFRVLKPGGVLLALFPIVEGWDEDYENSDIRSPRLRAIHFGKENHLRRFGRSVRRDFSVSGFKLHEFCANGREMVEFGLIPGERLFIGEKPL